MAIKRTAIALIAALIALALGMLLIPWRVEAQPACPVRNGCTGTSTIPSYGQILIGNSTGIYTPHATSTLGISTSDVIEGSKLFWTNARFDARLAATTSLQNLSTLLGLTSVGTIGTGVWQGTPIGDAYLVKSGDWSGTFDGAEGSAYLARANHTGMQAASTITGGTFGSGTFIFPSGSAVLLGSSTLQSFRADRGTTTNATSTNQAVTGDFWLNSERFTDLTGTGLQNSSGALTLNAMGDWTGTFDGLEGTSYLANSFSTTSADNWKNARNFFSTTSADHWETQQTARTADDLTNNSVEDLNDVAAMTEDYGDLLFWNGTAWVDKATSTLGISWNNLINIPAGFADGVDDTAGGGAAAVATATAETAGNIPFWTTTGGTPARLGSVATGTLSCSSGISCTSRAVIGGASSITLDSSGDWSGTFDGFEASALIAAGFSTTSANAWQNTRNFFSTTSANYWETQQTARSTDNLGDNNIDDLLDVNTSGQSGGNILGYDGSVWKPMSTSSYLTSSELDTIGELEAQVGAVNIILNTEIDTSGELATILTDETGSSGSFVRATQPTLSGFISTASSTIGDGTQTGGLTVFGRATSTSLVITGLSGCDTIDTDANGVLSCGTDASGAASSPATSTNPLMATYLVATGTNATSTFANARIGTTSQSSAHFEINNQDASYTSGNLRVISNSTAGGDYEFRGDSPNPDIEFVETDQTTPAGKWEFDVNNDKWRINSRNAADSSFEPAITVSPYRNGGILGVGTQFDTPNAVAEIAATSSLTQTFNVSTVVGANSGNLFTVFRNGRVGVGTTSPWAQFSVKGSSTEPAFVVASSSGSSMFKIDYTGSSTAANGINLTSGCYAMNGICLSIGSSQTPWTSNIDGGGFDLWNVTNIVANGDISGTTFTMTGDVVGSHYYSSTGGSAADPSYKFNGDGDTGMFDPGLADILAFTTNGTQRVTISKGGLVGIGSGTTSPWATLGVTPSSTSSPIVNFASSSGKSIFTISSTGAVLVGTTSASGTTNSLVRFGTSSAIFDISASTSKVGIGCENLSASRYAFGCGSNVNVNPNINLLVQDPTDARMGVSVGDSGLFMKSDGGLFGFNYAAGVAKSINLQEFGANVGIATATPWAKLSVVGSATTTGPVLVLASSSAATGTFMVMTATGTALFGNPSTVTYCTGCVNAKAVFDDNTLLSDWLFDLYFDGKVRADDAKHANRDLLTINETREYAAQFRHLPTIKGREEWVKEGGFSLGAIATQLWVTVETLSTHIWELADWIEAQDAQIRALEEENAALRAQAAEFEKRLSSLETSRQ